VIEFRMPSLGADMEQATLREWRVAPGDRVRRGDVVAVVDTDKAEIEVEAWDEGTVDTIVVPIGRTVPVGAVLALLRGTQESAAPAPTPAAQPAASAQPVPPVAPAAPSPPAALPPVPPPIAGERIRATPLARRLAAEKGIDLARVAGSGPGGAVTQADLAARAPGAPAATPPVPSPPAAPGRDGMRRAIAAAMQRAKREIPHYYLETAIDFGAARAWLEAANRERPIEERLLPSALLLRSVALALREVPELNGFWVDDRLSMADGVHLGFAVSLRTGGLLAPVVRDADRLGVAELMAGLRSLVSRARAGRLRSSEVFGATCTVTSLGDQGVDKVYGIIHPPQVALVGFGSLREQPWARDGWIAARPVLVATLSADHRASDGQRGARFLARVRWRLERPEEL
jgi:pyruvate dehydrogenase E2 component (dihydrolipoamide acetyltransferase)